jgi:pimeloyl-ACP methyl ester carboxylesterase
MQRTLAILIAMAVAVMLHINAVQAAPVSQEYLGLEVSGNLELAAAKTLEKDGAVLIVHGSLAHHRMEVIAKLQDNLKTLGVNSLAITLSLGLPKRSGMLDCKLEQDHRHADASDEIVAWIEWLQQKGASRVSLLGHSRGAGQAALAVYERADIGVRRLILAAPLYQTEAEIAARYQAAFGTALAPLLASARKAVAAGDGDTLLDVPGFMYCKPARVTAAAFLDYYAPDPQQDVLKLASQISIDTLLVMAGDDTVVPGLADAVTEARRTRQLPASVTLTTIDGADHFFRDLFGDELAEQVAKFANLP